MDYKKMYQYLLGMTAALFDVIHATTLHTILMDEVPHDLKLKYVGMRLSGVWAAFNILSKAGGLPYDEADDWVEGTAQKYFDDMEPEDSALMLGYLTLEKKERERFLDACKAVKEATEYYNHDEEETQDE